MTLTVRLVDSTVDSCGEFITWLRVKSIAYDVNESTNDRDYTVSVCVNDLDTLPTFFEQQLNQDTNVINYWTSI